MKIKKLFAVTLIFLSFQVKAYSVDTYMFGGAKLFNYGLEASDLQELNTSIVSLGFTSSTSSTDNAGIGYDIGFGAQIAPNFSIEGGYVNYGTLEINTNTTGPVQNIKTEITGDGVTGAVKYNLEGFYVKGGMHSWDFSGTVTTSLGSSTDAIGSGTDPFFGIGFGSEQFELGYEHYTVDDGDISALILRAAHKF